MLASEPSIPWSEIARMRDHLTHRYYDTSHATDGNELAEAVARMRETMPGDG